MNQLLKCIIFSCMSGYLLQTSWVALPIHSKCWRFFHTFEKALIFSVVTKWVPNSQKFSPNSRAVKCWGCNWKVQFLLFRMWFAMTAFIKFEVKPDPNLKLVSRQARWKKTEGKSRLRGSQECKAGITWFPFSLQVVIGVFTEGLQSHTENSN